MTLVRLTLATLATTVLAMVGTLAPAGADRPDADGVRWGRLDIVDFVGNPGDTPGGSWQLSYRDTARDRQCVRAALVDEDGTVLAVGPRSCGRWVSWRPVVERGAEDWPAPILIRSDGTRSMPWPSQ